MKVKCAYCNREHINTFYCLGLEGAGIPKDKVKAGQFDITKGTGSPPKPSKRPQKPVQTHESPKPDPMPTKPEKAPEKPTQETKTDADYVREWRERNRERYNESMRVWRENNRERLREYKREYMRNYRKRS